MKSARNGRLLQPECSSSKCIKVHFKMHFNGSVNACYSLNAFFPEWSEAEMRNVLMETNLEAKCTASRLKTGFMDANKRSDTFSTHSTYNLIKCTIDSQWFRLTHIAGLRVCGRVSFSSPHFLASSHSSHSTSLRMSRDNYSSFDVLFSAFLTQSMHNSNKDILWCRQRADSD